MLSTREVFPKAPLAMVVAEIRYSYNPQLDQPGDKAKVLDAIKADLPVWQRRTENTFGLALGVENAQITPSSTVDLLEAGSADSQITAALSAEMLTLAMSGKAYTMFEESLRPLLAKAVAGLHAQFPETLVTRAGLRYLDEIRVPEQPTTLDGWAPWIAVELLGGVDLLAGSGGRVVAMRSSYQYALSANRRAVLNWGPFFGTGVVGPEHPFHRADVPPEHMFVLDVDMSWTPPAATPLDPPGLVSVYDGLHEPTQAIFRAALTERSLDLFRSHA